MFNSRPSCNFNFQSVNIKSFGRQEFCEKRNFAFWSFKLNKLEAWTCYPIQDANLADKEASKTIQCIQFELDSLAVLILRKESLKLCSVPTAAFTV